MERSILEGDLSELPDQDSNIVRIFASSTSKDTYTERNYLMKHVYPQVRNACLKLGLEFEVVDMRWGISDEQYTDHQTTELCLQEISRCQELSQGPNFMAFIGDRYGFRSLPAVIEEDEFEILLKVLNDNGKNVTLLQKWFKKDENFISPKYVLHSSCTTLLHHNDNSDMSKQNCKDKEKCLENLQEIQELLKEAAQKAVKKEVLTTGKENKYVMSVTEKEITQGIINSQDAPTQCACFVRVLQDIPNAVDDDNVKLYFDDMASTEKQRLDDLRFDKVGKVLDKLNLNYFEVSWGVSVDSISSEHKKYLKLFGESVKSVLLTLIHEFADKRLQKGATNRSELFTEVLHHNTNLVRRCASFYGREKLLDALKFMLGSRIKIPEQDVFVIYGSIGSGKSSMCAMLAKNARVWFHEATMVVISRFLGTSPNSSNIIELISSLCDQMCEVYHFETSSREAKSDINLMIQHFHGLLQQIESPQLLIVLDSINQLTTDDNAYSLNWLPDHLNKNVSIVVSTLPEHGNVLSQLKKRYSFPDNFLEIGPMTSNSVSVILSNWFDEKKRKLTLEQYEYLRSCCESCAQPIYLQLAFHQAIKWESYKSVSSTTLPLTIISILSSQFQEIETRCGGVLVSHALGYITASKNGLTESELLDILSLDDILLNQVFQLSDPPSKDFVRFPSLLWKRIRYQLDTHLSEKHTDGCIVLHWCHQLFQEVAADRYLSDVNKAKYMYSNLADYFLGKYSDGNKKPNNLSKRSKVLENADRQVKAQPLRLQKKLYNLRKLNELPLTLMKCNRHEELFKCVFFNFEWIECKVKALSVSHVLKDLQQYTALHDDQEVKIIHDALELMSIHIEEEKNSMACQLLGTLMGFEDSGMENIKKLLNECRRYIYALSTPVLLLRSACMIPPGGTLRTTLNGHCGNIEKVMFIESIDYIICTCREKENAYHLYFWSISQRCNFKTLKFACNGYANIIWTKGWEYVLVIADQLSYVSIQSQLIKHTVKKNGSISNVKERPDGNLLAISHTNGLVRFFDVNERKFITEFDEWKDICCITFLSNSTEVAISSNTFATLVLLNYSSHQARHFEAPRQNMKHSSTLLAMANDSVLISSSYETINVWDVINVSHSYSLEHHHDKILCMEKINEDAFASGSKDNSVKIWSVGQRALLKNLTGHENAISCLKYCMTSKRLFSGSRDDYIKIWNLETSLCEYTLRGHSSCVTSMDVSHDGSVVASGSADRKVKIWNTTLNKKQIRQPKFIHHQKLCRGVVVSKDGSYAATISGNEKLTLWHESKRVVLREIQGDVTCAAFSSQNSMLLLGTSEGVVTVYDMTSDTFNSCFTHKSHYKSVTGLHFLDETQIVISAGDDGNVTICDLHFQEELSRLEIHHDAITCFRLSNDKTVLVSGGRDKTVNVYNVLCGESVKHMVKLNGHEKLITCLDISLHNEFLLSGDGAGIIMVWNIYCGENILKFKAFDDALIHLTFLPGNKFISASHDSINQMKMWDITAGVLIEYDGHSHAVLCVRCTTDTKYILSSSRDGTLKLWEVTTGKVLDSINFNSQIKYFDISDLCESHYYKAVAVTKNGSVAFMRILLPGVMHGKRMNGTLILLNKNNLPDNPKNLIPVQTKNCCCNII